MPFSGLRLFLFAVVFWQFAVHISYGKLDTEEPFEIFRKYHTAVVSVIAHTDTEEVWEGTGFSINAEEHWVKVTGEKIKLVVTAFHIVKGSNKIDVRLYLNEKDNDGNWKFQVCRANVRDLDIVRDVAILLIFCDSCNCSGLATLETRLSTVNDGETILAIGDSRHRRVHSFISGTLTSTNFTYQLASVVYKQENQDVIRTLFSRVHGLTGSVNIGDSGSAVLDVYGKVIGMVVAISGDMKLCVTMEEIIKAREQILNTLVPQYVGCTTHESFFLGKTYWPGRSGRSIAEMNALATAMNAKYFAVAHDGRQAHAFTFHALLWDITSSSEDMEEAVQCLCEKSSFTDGEVLLRHYMHDDEVMCGCSGNACRQNESYRKRYGEDNDRRWAIYTRVTPIGKDSDYYIPSKESKDAMKDLAVEIDYWKKKVDDILKRDKEEL